jgi:hypothetical protein
VLTQIDTWLDKEKGFGSQVQGIWWVLFDFEKKILGLD